MKSVMVRFRIELDGQSHVLTFQFRDKRAWFIADNNLITRQHFSLREWKLQYPFSGHIDKIRLEYRRIVDKYKWKLPESITYFVPTGKIDMTVPAIYLITQYDSPMRAIADGIRDFWFENGLLPDIPVYLVSETPAKMVKVLPRSFLRLVE